MKSTRHQAPGSKEAPGAKLQKRDSWIDVVRVNSCATTCHWCLRFGASLVLGAWCLVLFSCSTAHSTVNRTECMALAEQYRTHRWLPTQQNVMHGVDAD